jgi:uncharacterized protein YndB with AHSA1/START domain
MTTPETTIVEEPGSHAATVSAVVDAPKEAVFRAFTDPELITKWWGPAELTSKVEQYDARSGGAWRIVHVDPDGNEYGFHGVFHLVSPDQITMTFEFEGAPGHVSLETATFEDLGGKTKVTMHDVYQSVEDRDAMMDSGGRDHAPVAFAQLTELLQTV